LISILFSPIKIGDLELQNRFVRSATYEAMAKETGEITNDLITMYQRLAKADIGLIISGYMFIHPKGKAMKLQVGIHNDDMMPGLKNLVDNVHSNGGKIAFQIVHAGMQSYKEILGMPPKGPSAGIRSPITLKKSKEMNEDEINESIQAFPNAVERAIQVGVDVIQLHAAHGYLINQFLSPYFNRRTDIWGGSDENNFRFFKEVIIKTKKTLPKEIPLIVKLNVNDFKEEGITPALAIKYTKWLVELGIDGLEISCGSPHYATYNMCRGRVPLEEYLQFLPSWQKPLAKLMFKKMIGKFGFDKPYNVDAAKAIKTALNSTPLMVVGGIRTLKEMENILDNNYADMISMSRPFIKEPFLVKNLREGKINKTSCESCNRCLAAVACHIPVKCYVNSFPNKK